MKSELWLQERMEMQEYMEMLQDVGMEMECYIIAEILAEMNAEFHMQVIEKTEAMKVLFYYALTICTSLHKFAQICTRSICTSMSLFSNL